ncbi:uncharacterized protein LOC141621878 [Silene latifolia]|uniref:uncharacterized protein LOC141621878 n=1 Tax=Silene latifolia TaxID=37657 RepID=UPI003D785740
MSTNGSSSNGLSSLPIFKGVKYQFWELKMKTLFKSQELWELVETGFEDSKPAEPDQALKDKRKKDAKALFILQQALDEEIFPRIASATTSKEAWHILQKEYVGDKKVVKVRLQSLRREFETALMKDKETVQEYLSRMTEVVQQMKAYGEQMTNEHVVGKILRSLTQKFDHLVAAIEQTSDLDTYTLDELMGSLQAHEERLNKSSEQKEEKAFQVKDDSSKEKSNQFHGRGRGRGRGGYRGRGRGRFSGQSSESQEQKSRSSLKCYYCNKPGHKEVDCWKKKRDQEGEREAGGQGKFCRTGGETVHNNTRITSQRE